MEIQWKKVFLNEAERIKANMQKRDNNNNTDKYNIPSSISKSDPFQGGNTIAKDDNGRRYC